jgi:D-psicose/D-tagatose/L-ribulose 3-epimerase
MIKEQTAWQLPAEKQPATARLKIHLCNEVVRTLDFRGQCAFAQACGYDGLEIAPFTLADDPTRLPIRQITELRSIAEDQGTRIAGLHWLLAAPANLSITSEDPETVRATRDAGRRLIDLCAGLGGTYLVHGSPQQRRLAPGREAQGRSQAIAYFSAMADAAQASGVDYILEPLSRLDTTLAAGVAEAVAMVTEISSPALKTMVDCYAVSADGEDVAAVLDQWLARGVVSHVHFNDDNKGGPGQGGIDFARVLQTLERHAYAGATAVEPFVYLPDGPACAARAIEYLRGLEQDRSPGERPTA